MKTKRFQLKLILLLFLLLLISVPFVIAETPQEKGRKIMEQVDSLPVPEKVLNNVDLYIFDSQGEVVFTKKTRSARYYANFRDSDKRY